jgi:hypothetical protein
MTDPQKNHKITSSCGDYSAEYPTNPPLAEVYEPNFSTAEGAAHVDQFGEEKHLPAHLDLKTPFRFFTTNALGITKSRVVSLEQWVRQAQTNAVARKELLNLIQSRSQDPDVQNRSLAIRNDNILEIMAQVASSSKNARRVGAEALAYFIEKGTSDKNLKVGLLRTVDEIRTPEALQVLKEVYKNAPELRPEIEKLPTNGFYLKHQASPVAQSPKNETIAPSDPATQVGSGSVTPSLFTVSNLTPETPLLTSFISSLVQTLEKQVDRSPALKPLFDPITYSQISERFLATAQNIGVEMDTLIPYLRLAILGDAWKNPLLSLQQFAEFSRTTNRWVKNTLVARTEHEGKNGMASQPALEVKNRTSFLKNPPLQKSPMRLAHFPDTTSIPRSEKPNKSDTSYPTSSTTGAITNPLVVNMAGLQGSAMQGILGSSLNHRLHSKNTTSSDYYIEPVTSIDEEGQQSFSQNSHQDQQENSQQNSKEQDNYWA